MAQSVMFVCQECGKTYPKWQGKCDNCGAWSSLVEEAVIGKKSAARSHATTITATPLSEIKRDRVVRLPSGVKDVDIVLGGGIVPGSIILLGGEPGIGKSTLLLQIASHIANSVYISGEESVEQISLRADRLGVTAPINLVQETDIDSIIKYLEHARPALAIIDSIQTVVSTDFPGVAGSIVQVRSAAQRLQILAKSSGIPIVLVGHVTKEGTIAGPRTLEHIVDVVLSFEGEPFQHSRILRGLKNRFGATNEVAILAMTEKGLESVANPSALFLANRVEAVPGSVITAVLEGRRPLIIEIQALTVPTNFGYPKRTAVGFDVNRLNVLVAVLQRRATLKLEASDIYVNVVGGIRLQDPGADVAVCMAIASSFYNQVLPSEYVAIGEVGLLGEIRDVTRQKDRLAEAKRLGFSKSINAKTIQEAVQRLIAKG